MNPEVIPVLVNPAAGGGRSLRLVDLLRTRLEELGLQVELIITQSEAHLRFLTQKFGRKRKLIVGVGGDSTFHIMANELLALNSPAALSLVGVGSSNDLPREFGLVNLETACLAIKQGLVREIDVAAIIHNGQILRYVLGQVNLGLGVSVNEFVASLPARSIIPRWQTLAGFLGIIRAFAKKEIPIPLSIQTQKSAYQGKFNLALFSNIRFWATGRKIFSQASPHDGLFDLCLIRACSLLRMLQLAALAGQGKPLFPDHQIIIDQASSFLIHSPRKLRLQSDGEIIKKDNQPVGLDHFELKVIPRRLKLVTLS